MARRIAVSTLNASTIDILNVIRQNASTQYQSNVPEIAQALDIPKVGEVLFGYPALANEFINALVNRIALVRVNSATFNNPYAILKKGYLEFGETVEEIFVNIAKAVHFDVEKAPAREFKRTVPDVKSAFHVMNWRVMYPVSIQQEDLKRAFLNLDGVTDLIAKIVESVYTAAEYDEFLLFKYLLIKSVTAGKMKPVSVGDGTNLKTAATAFRGTSNMLPFLSSKYNEAGVKTTTPKSRQVIFMDALYNASYDVEVLASAFNMDKADFMGRLFLIDNWTEFDNERFEVIRAESDGLEEVTATELALMEDVKAIMLDEEWFQIYDNLNTMEETKVSSGLYWNYFYHVWKTISVSPFSNAIVFATSDASTTQPAELTVSILSKDTSAEGITLTLGVEADTQTLAFTQYNFVQTEALTTNGIGIHPYGAVLIPADKIATNIKLVLDVNGTLYGGATNITGGSDVGDTVTLAPVVTA